MSEKTLKKITVLELSNQVLDDRVNHLVVRTSDELEQLKDYVLGCDNFSTYDDPELIFKILEWVASQWKHDGMNDGSHLSSYEILQNAKKGEQYRCVEYGKVTADILLSFGYVSRSVGVTTKDVSYGGFGMGHVATEVWSNHLDKWIFIDPQFSIYAKYEDQYLNFHDIYELKLRNQFDDVEFIVPSGYVNKNEINILEYIKSYKEFLINYFGFLSIGYKKDEDVMSLRLMLDGEAPYLTFQGFTDGNSLYTENRSDIYYTLNHTSIILTYKEKTNIMKIIEQYSIKSNEDFILNMPNFAPVPNFNVKLHHNMLFFSHFEVKIDDLPWEKLDSNTCDWKLNEGVNTLQARAVNTFNNKGVISFIKISYE